MENHLINGYFPKSELVWSEKRKTPESAKNYEIAVKVLLNIIRTERYLYGKNVCWEGSFFVGHFS